MHPPTRGHEHILGNKCIAQFAYLKQLYRMEEGKPLKVAHALKRVSLNPSSIAWTSPQHALGKLKVLQYIWLSGYQCSNKKSSCYSTMTIDYGTTF